MGTKTRRPLKNESEWLSLRVPPEHRVRLRQLAEESGESMSQIVREVIECYLQADTEARRAKEARRSE